MYIQLRINILVLVYMLLLGVVMVGNVKCQEYSKIDGRKGNVSDPNADILEVNFQLLENRTFIIRYVIAGNFDLKRYIYGINLYDYGVNQTLYPIANIILGTFEQKKGVWLVNSSTLKVDSLQYTIQGSTLTIRGLTIEQLGRYAFYATADTAQQPTVEHVRTVIWVDHEPRQGAVKIMFPSPTTSPTNLPQTEMPPPQTTHPQSTTPIQNIPTETTQHTQPTTWNYLTQVTIIIIVFIILSGLALWRSRSKRKIPSLKKRKM